MLSRNVLGSLILLVHRASYSLKTTARNLNATKTSDAYPTIPTCCYIDSFGVGLVLWYTGSVEVTVATVSTIYAIAPNRAFNDFGSDKISGVPTNIIGSGLGGYEADTTLITGTEFTDPYGVVHTSPTPGSTLQAMTQCMDRTGEIFVPLPEQLKDWVVSHVPPNTDALYSELAQCTLAFGDGILVAHVPVTELTRIYANLYDPRVRGPSYLNSNGWGYPPASSNSVSTSSPGLPPASSTAPGEVISTSPNSGPGSTAGSDQGGVQTSSAGSIVASGSSSPSISASSGNSGPGSTGAGNGNNGGSQTAAAGAGSQSSAAGNGHAGGLQSIGAVGGSQTTNAGVGSGGNGNTITTTPPPSTVAPIFTAGGSAYTGVITASGETLSLESGGKTVVLVSGTSTQIESLCGIIASFRGFSPTTAGRHMLLLRRQGCQ
ncbi:hypothetical protein BDZ45DRAFT_803432 [Acephala macrosclerotiorum]|nr:hypothetical protein BDZ45DRAFT_803432 [Acephala macrosclerotiorum]